MNKVSSKMPLIFRLPLMGVKSGNRELKVSVSKYEESEFQESKGTSINVPFCFSKYLIIRL